MNRPALVLAVCAGLALAGSAVQSIRAARFRTEAVALGSDGVPLEKLDADIAELRARISPANRPSPDAARPKLLPELADALVREVKTAGAELTRLTIEPAGPTLALSATGGRFAIARLVSRVDGLLESHEAHADRFSIAGGHEDMARIDLSVGTRSELGFAPVATPVWPTVDPAVVATSLVSTRAPDEAAADASAAPGSRAGDLARRRDEASSSPVVSWIGTITADGGERYVLRFEQERIVAVLGEGGTPVLGWTVVSHGPGRLQLSKEGALYEVRR